MTIIQPVSIGVLSGLAVQLLVVAFRRGYVPLVNRLTQDSLSGDWVSEYQEGVATYNETISIRQVGRTIQGTAILNEQGKQLEVQEIRGTYKHQILTAEYWSSDRNVIERGTFTLKRATPERLEGYFTFFSGDPLELTSSKYIWRRT